MTKKPVDDDEITKALDFLNAVPNGYSFQPIDQERFERYVAMIAKQIEWLQSICADYAERAVKDGEQKIKDVQLIKKLFTHPVQNPLSDEALKMAIECLEYHQEHNQIWGHDVEGTIAYCIEALAQPTIRNNRTVQNPLSDEEIEKLANLLGFYEYTSTLIDFARAIEKRIRTGE
jgi:translation elongation factor EF-G